MSMSVCTVQRVLMLPFARSGVFYRNVYNNPNSNSTFHSVTVSRYQHRKPLSFNSSHNLSRCFVPQTNRITLFGNVFQILPNRSLHLQSRIWAPVRTARIAQDEWAELQKLSLMKRLHVMLKKYWYVAIPLHCVNCGLWLLALYLGCRFCFDGTIIINKVKPYIIDSNLIPDAIKKLFEKDHSGSMGNLAVALLLYKLLTPGRYATTVMLSVYAVNYLLRRGVLVKSASEIKTSMQNSYINHAVNKNIQRRVEKMKLRLKKYGPRR